MSVQRGLAGRDWAGVYVCMCVCVRASVCSEVAGYEGCEDIHHHSNMSEGSVVVVDLDLAQQALFECVLVLFVLLVLLFFSFSVSLSRFSSLSFPSNDTLSSYILSALFFS